MHNYADDHHGRLPPAVVYGEDDEPLYSWRVLLLPYFEQNALYEQFHLDEPWDSPHNLALLAKMPGTYEAPGSKKSKVPPYHTVCHVFVGKGTPFEGREGLRLPQDLPDGTSNTILVIEAGEPVPWTKPDDLVYDPYRPLPDLRSLFKDGFRVALGDGSTHWVTKQTSEATLRAAITRNGGEALGLDW
jgi:Protein of unknown function (DUF1559)